MEDPAACADAIQHSAAFGRALSNAEEVIGRCSIEKWCADVKEIYDKVIGANGKSNG